MKTHALWILLGLLGPIAGMARGELMVIPAREPVHVFGGAGRMFPVEWENTGDIMATADVRMRLLQASTATTATLGEWPWKRLQVLAGQTITERAALDFPEVKAETHFLIGWFEGTNRMFGTTEVLVYPTNLLVELKILAGDEHPPGVFDPDNVLKSLLKKMGVEFEDLAESGIASFRGKLAIVGPFSSPSQMPCDLGERLETLARKGTGVVWLQPPPRPYDKLEPSFRAVPVSDGAVVVVQAQLFTNPAENPEAQLNLVNCCRLARNPEAPRLPHVKPQP